MTVRRDLVVVGGGITGLAAAWEASERDGVSVTVVEAGDRLGGKIRTSPITLPDGTTLRIDEGADAFLARVPDAVRLCEELGLGDELTSPAVGRAKVLVDGELRFLPARTVLGVPLDLDELEAAGLLSPAGLEEVRAGDDPSEPPLQGDVAIGPFLTGRFGRELVDRVVGPLIGGINAGDVDELSLRAVTPQLADAAEEGGSLAEALRRKVPATTDAPVFHALLDGTGRLVEVLAERLDERGVELRTGTRVERIEGADGEGGLRLRLVTGSGSTQDVEAAAVLVATPAPAAAELLEALSPEAAGELRSITHSSPVLVTLVHHRGDVPAPLDASGFLVPRDAGRFATAASFGSTKWAHWDDGEHVVLRVSAGHSADRRPDAMSDEEVVEAIRADLEEVLGITAEPLAARVSRYPDGFAQYEVGHLDRVERIEAALARDVPGLAVAGAAYRGVGIPACIRQGRGAARRLLGAPST